MMKLWYSYIKELQLASKGFYFYIEFVLALIIIAILLFIVPEELNQQDDEYLSFDMPAIVEENYRSAIMEKDLDGIMEKTTLKLNGEPLDVDLYETEDSLVYIIPTRDQMIELTEKERPKVGAHIRFDATLGELVYEYHLQGYESERLLNLYRIIHNEDLRVLEEMADNTEVETLNIIETPLNSRLFSLPAILAFNGSLMGMFIIAAYIFLDKDEGIISAYAITASHIWQYLLSKILVMTTVTIITTLAIVMTVAGSRVNYPMLLLLLITSSFAASAFGLLLSSFYDNMTKAFAGIYSVMILLMLPAIEYFVPSWQPIWMRLIPTYYLIQGFKDVVINDGSMNFVIMTSIVFLLAGILLFFWDNHRFKRNLVS